MLPIFKTKKFPVECIKKYNNVMHIESKLSDCAKSLIGYLCQSMDAEDNFITHNIIMRDSFIKFMKKNCNKKYTHETVKKAMSELSSNDLLRFRGLKARICNTCCYTIS